MSAFRNGGSAREKGVEPNIVANADAKLAKFFGLSKKTPQEIAIERHAKRDAAKVQQAWNERRIASIEAAVKDLRDTLASSNSSLEEIKSKTEKLQEVSMQLGQKVYEAAQQAQNAQNSANSSNSAPNEGASGNTSSNGDTMDADFEEVK